MTTETMRSLSLLQEASSEIKALRRKNELMAARLDVFDTLMRVFHTSPTYKESGLVHPDIVFEIDKYVEGQTLETNKPF